MTRDEPDDRDNDSIFERNWFERIVESRPFWIVIGIVLVITVTVPSCQSAPGTIDNTGWTLVSGSLRYIDVDRVRCFSSHRDVNLSCVVLR